MKRIISGSLLLVLLTVAARAQQAAIGFGALDRTLDFKVAKAGDQITLHLTRDLVVNGKTVLPHGTAVSASIVDKDGNVVSIVLGKATPKDGGEVQLMGIIAAVATPPADLSQDPFYSMNRSMEPSRSASETSAAEGSAVNPGTSSASSGAAVATANLKGENASKSNLQDDSSGAIGIDGLKLAWVLDKAPATTVMTAKKKNFKLPGGTEILLRMAPPLI